MIAVFDLREKQDDGLLAAVRNFFDEPLEVVRFGEQSISACIGCWNCWLKTPGRCALKDPMAASYPEYVQSETVILLMDTAQGFINHQAKAFLDRTIPHYHPYIEIVGGECHHRARYSRYPDMVFHYDSTGLTDQEEQVIEDYLYRTAYHFKSRASRFEIEIGEPPHVRILKPRNAHNRMVAFGSTEPMQHLVIYNGSPRRSKSNSGLILGQAAEALGDRVEIRDLKQREQWPRWAEAFEREQHVMFFTPLYVHAMPSHVMAFLELLSPSAGSIGFFVQSGFPESSQSHYLEAYFEQLALRLDRTYLGTAIKGGVESLQERPPKAREQMIQSMVNAIVDLVDQGSFNAKDIQGLAMPVKFGSVVALLVKLFIITGVMNKFWDQRLKANQAFEQRFAQPFDPRRLASNQTNNGQKA